MSTVLVYTSPARGHLYPLVPTLLELRARGHRVVVRTLAGEVPVLEPLGVEAGAIDPRIEARELDDWKATNPLGQMDRTFTTWLDRAEIDAADLTRAVTEVAPDTLLVDVNAWGALAAAEASGLPTTIFAPYFLTLRAPGRPPFGMGLPQGDGLVHRLRDALLWPVTRWIARAYVKRLNVLRARLGVPALRYLDELTSRADRVLALTAEPFEYGHGGWPANVRFVGPGIWEPTHGEAPAGTRPLVLVTCSTEFQDDGRLVTDALAALADEPVDVVATTGAIDPATIRAPANAQVVRFAAHGPLLRRAAAVVCHGGMGITQKALAAGVPVCVVGWGRDQLDVARHVERCGAGVSVPRGRLTPLRLRDAVRETMARQEAARAVAMAFARAGGPVAAADVIEEIFPRVSSQAPA